MTQARRLLAASLLAVAAGLFAAPRAQAAPVASPAGVAEFEPFRNHGAAMLLLAPGDGRILDANAAATHFYGYPPEQLIGRTLDELTALDNEAIAGERALAQLESRSHLILPQRLANGRVRAVEFYASPLAGSTAGGGPAQLAVLQDVEGLREAEARLAEYRLHTEEAILRNNREAVETQSRLRQALLAAVLIQALIIALLIANVARRRRVTRALVHREEQLTALIDAMPDLVCFKDGAGRWRQVNAFAVRQLGLEGIDYHNCRNLELAERQPFHHDTFHACEATDEAAWQQRGVYRREERIPSPDNPHSVFDVIKVPLFNPDGSRRGMVVIGRDITARKAADSEIERLAYFDPLTNLPNRRLLQDRIANAQAGARRSGRYGAILLVDLDYFKTLNEARGHEMGDRLLKAVAERLTGCLREADTVARFGGDEFVLLLPDLASHAGFAADMARSVAAKVRNAVALPYPMDDEDVVVAASIGVTLVPNGQATTIADLLKQAETAMYQAKEAGRDQVRFFEPEMQARVEARFALEGDLRHAVERGELQMYLQPQVDAAGQIQAAEALMRWQHPQRGLVPPSHFIPVAEETGLILELGEWAMRETCRLLARAEATGTPIRMAVNVSPRQFHRSGFIRRVRDILAETGADPTRLTMEVTEGLVIDRVHQTVATMSELRALGVHFSIDDFGTGYSSLAYLKRLPINELKIDKTFIQDAPTDPNDAALIDTILAVAAHLRLNVVAEGVETREQADFLTRRAPMLYQGYLFGRPEPAEGLLERLAAQKVVNPAEN